MNSQDITNSTVINEDSQSLENVINGNVSGDVEIITENPWDIKGELNYTIPDEAKNIKTANVYINIYSGSGSNPDYILASNTTLKTINGNYNLGYEILKTNTLSPDGTVHKIDGNDHVTRVYSDYQINYNITDSLKGLNGTSISINVDSINIGGIFDGRIKLIALVLAYDDGDDDEINYWIDYNQYYTKTTTNVVLNTTKIKKYNNVILTNVVLSSTDASCKINNKPIYDLIEHEKGDYYNYNQWDVTDNINTSSQTTINYYNNGESLKSVLNILKFTNQKISANITNAVGEYENIAYAGTINQLTMNIVSDKNADCKIRLSADNIIVNTTQINLKTGNNKILITDPTIRPLDETTVMGSNNKKVNWTIEILSGNEIISTYEITSKILYNGYLGAEYEYGIEPYKSLINSSFTGDIIIDIKTTYTSAGDGSRTDTWNVNLDKNSKIAGAYIIIPYNWFDYSKGNEDINMIQAIFNGKTIKAISFAHDNPNIGWNFGYGVLIFEVTDSINLSGNNTLILNRLAGNPALNPSALIYFYNTTLSTTINNLYMVNGYDLLLNDYNKAGRINQAKSQININASDMNNATIYLFAAGAEKKDGYIVINNNEFKNCWSGSASTTDLFKTNITHIINDTNEISLISTGGTLSALPYFVIVNKNFTQGNYTPKPSIKINIIVKAPNFKAKFKKSKYYKVIVKNKNTNKALANVKIIIKIFTGKKSKKYSLKTNKKGLVKINTKKLKIGKHKVFISSNDVNYIVTAKSKIIIKK